MKNDMLYDVISGYDITIKEGDLYLIKNGVIIKLADNETILNNQIREEN